MNMSNLIITPRSPLLSTLQDLSFERKRENKLPSIIKLASRSPKTGPSFSHSVVLPEISRLATPSPRKLSPILIHTSEKQGPLEKQLINLEKIILQEEKISTILKVLSTDLNIGNLCSEYWEIGNNEALWSLEKLFKDPRIRKAVIDSIIIESLGISLLIFCSNSTEEWGGILNQIKNMVYFMHQNFLTIIDLILSRLPIEASASNWVVALTETVKSKKIKGLKRPEHSAHLKQHNEIISNCIRTIIRLLPMKSSPKINTLLHILANRDKFSIPVARSYLFQEPSSAEITISPPFLPENHERELTLVLDLDETLVHYAIQGTTGQLLIRPYCAEFLKEMANHYEIYADWAIGIIDSYKVIKFRLYRQHTMQIGPVYIKDLSKIGRDLKKCLIVDNMPSNFQLQPENGIFIKSWVGDLNDVALKEMGEFLQSTFYLALALTFQDDIRQSLHSSQNVLNLSV